MRIAYGVHGYGRGHATRALSVLPDLARNHKLLVLAGGDAYDAIAPDAPCDVMRIPTLAYHYSRSGRRSNFLTFIRNAPAVLDLALRGVASQMVRDAFRDFLPDVVISDAEPWTHHSARRLGIPRIGFDHFGILVYCRASMGIIDRMISFRDALIYKLLMGQPDRAIVSSFYDAPPLRPGVRCVGSLLRHEVREISARRSATDGEFLLAYFNKGQHLYSKRIETALRESGYSFRIYGVGRIGREGNMEYRPACNRVFLEDLAGCRGVISTAGNQLVGEAMHFGKPLLVIPEDCVEQRVNARALASMGIGMCAQQRTISAETIQTFVGRRAEFVDKIRGLARDSRVEAVSAIEAMITELTRDTRNELSVEATRDAQVA